MDGTHRPAKLLLAFVLLGAGFSSCTPRTAVEDLPTPERTLAEVGRRLSRKLSAGELTEIARDGDRVLSALTRAERDALARGALRFRIDRPADIIVAVPPGPAPFWLRDLGFTRLDSTLCDGAAWILYKKAYGAGWVGLGVNGLDRRPKAHYAVFVAGDKPLHIQGLDAERWEQVVAQAGVRLARDATRPAAELPRALLGATLLRTSNDLRHAAMLARGRVWKTHSESRPTPDQVVVAFGADATRELVVSWRTSEEVADGTLRIRSRDGKVEKIVAAASERIVLPDLLNDPAVRRHSAHVEGLEPNTTYDYTIGSSSVPGGTFAGSVRTAPRGDEDVCLLYMGDPQCGLEGWGTLLAAARRARPDATALLIAGDLVDRGNERTNWDHFFLRAAGVFENLPLMPAAGNHEYLDRGPWLFRSFFTHPANGPAGLPSDLVYSFEAGDAFVAVLDGTSAVSDPAASRLQAEWLDARLAETRRTWKLVMFHHPVYASHPTREQPQLAAAWVPVFDRHHVDVVLQGHDHAYMRSYPLRSGRRVDSAGEGTVYVVSVSGDKYCEQRPREETAFGMTRVSTYQTIVVSARGRRLVYEARDLDGRKLDAFTIEKPGAAERLAQTTAAGPTSSSSPPRK